MNKCKTWFGTDASNQESLFEYGFLMRWQPKRQQYQVIYLCGYLNHEPQFSYSYFDAEEWREDLKNGTYDLEGMADMCSLDTETYLDEVTNDSFLLNDLLHYYGTAEVFTDYRKVYTKNEIKKRLNKALSY